MKLRILFAFSFFLLLNTSGYGQWSVSGSNTLSNYLSINAIHFFDANTGFIGGTNDFFDGEGRISKTTNGGASWKVVLVEPYAAIKDIVFINSSIGFAVGNDGFIAKTINGGEDWTTQRISTSGNSENFNAVYFADANTGYAVGGSSSEIVYKTTNGGSTWSQVTGFQNAHKLNTVHFINANTGIVAGGDQFSGASKIYRTTNGGNSWDTISTSAKTFFNATYFIDNNNGFMAGGSGTILKTTNGGLTWSSTTNQDASKGAVTAIDFINNTHGFATTQLGRILKTVDGGNTWTIDANISNYISSLYSISVISQTKGFAVGLSGTYAVKTGSTGITSTMNAKVNVSPNPAKASITVDLPSKIDNATLTIFNMNGQIAYEKNNLEQKNNITLPEMAEGLYILTIQHSEGTIKEKLVISK